jgi:hypothetical protein
MRLARKRAAEYDIARETFEAWVPAEYDGRFPYGLVVFVGAADSGACPPEYAAVLGRRRLIWIGANNGGNKREPPNARLGLALDAAHNMAKRYRLDAERVYASGFDGGGSVAALLCFHFPDVFAGGFPMCAPAPGWASGGEADAFVAPSRPKPEQFRLLAGRSRIALLTGANDANRAASQDAAGALKREKLNATCLESPGAGHLMSPPALVDEAIAFLDRPLRDGAKKDFEKAAAAEKANQPEAALDGYTLAAIHGGDLDFAPAAMAKAAELGGRCDSAVLEIEQALDGGKAEEALRALEELRRLWPRRAAEAAKRLEPRLKAAAPPKPAGAP